MSDDSKYEEMSASTVWDIAVNAKNVKYSDKNRTVRSINACTVRTQFWSSGRHVLNIRVNAGGHMGIGIITKAKDVSSDWIGHCKNSWALWDTSTVYLAGQTISGKNKIKFAQDDIVTVDVDLNKKTLNWAVNGQYISNDDFCSNIPNQIAIAVSLWRVNQCVEIIQDIHYK